MPVVAPKSVQPDKELMTKAKEIAKDTGNQISISENLDSGIKDCDFICTDVWVSMGEPEDVWKERVDLPKPCQVNAAVMQNTCNPEAKFYTVYQHFTIAIRR